MMAWGRGKDRSSVPKARLNTYYRGSRSQQSSPFQKKPVVSSLHSKLVKLVDILIIVIVAFCLIYSLIVSPNPKTIVSSNIYEPTYIYQASAAKDLKVLKNRSKLTFDEAGVITSLQKQFPEIDSASVELPLFGQKPIIRINVAFPAIELSSTNKKYIVDTAGKVVSTDLSLAKSRNLPELTDQSGFGAALGKQVLSSGEVAFIGQLVAQCKASDVPIASLVLPPRAQELDLRTKDKPYYIKFYLAGDAQIQIGQFLAARHQFATTHKDPSKYLDVRVSGKIFYK